ncbi:Os09g0412601 [Oryza sativa Japonica Group]|uniref:Os09g0412601 protein n=1 Tax=Oryza sativa subsp. japonica TaxID=39947 RepID=Q6ES40_ORYSJ|nr:hypothetical protein [Oryza sativa Japonica Group]BAD28530.1 hypothetical protein [Oryza sativa Japonica Group]BAH94563.1 Os09g0412601 [Oryza sativa Japonica Group]|eukprot:NP_001175835.1 Os09g0412601 [Oryza sativa Japonica Group]
MRRAQPHAKILFMQPAAVLRARSATAPVLPAPGPTARHRRRIRRPYHPRSCVLSSLDYGTWRELSGGS